MAVKFFSGVMLLLALSFVPNFATNRFCLLQETKIEKKGGEKDTLKGGKSGELFKKLFEEDHPIAKGLVNIHKIDGKLYFELPITLFEKNILLGSTITETSDNGNVTVGSKPVPPLLINFTKYNENIALNKLEQNSITFKNNLNIRRALDKNSVGAIMQLFKIESYNSDSSSVVIDVTDFFKSDREEITPFDSYSANTALGTRTQVFKGDRSLISDFKSFEENFTVKSTLSYGVTLTDRNRRAIYTDKPYTVVVTRSFLLLEDEPYTFRVADPRVGIFNSARTMFSDEGNRAEELHFAHRWRVEPSDIEKYRRGEKVEPTKQIVFYIDKDFPEWWKPHIKAAVERWNDAFEKIGFVNVVSALSYPEDDPDFDPDNIKYSCIRYSPVEVENAMGPSWVDPRSGEIINASVYVYHDVIKLLNKWLFVQTSPADKRVRSTTIPRDILGDALEYVLAHEVGHCLGFMHNMGSSAVIPVDSLRSPTYTQKYGTTLSIMDYARFNYVAQPGDLERGVRLTPPFLGLYDYYIVKWLYEPLFIEDPFEERDYLAKWVTELSGNKIYRYGKQQLFSSCDPTSQMEDLGDDPIKASEYGIKNLKFIMENINRWLQGEDRDYIYRTEIYREIANQYLRYLGHVTTNVGGVIVNERFEGDKLPHYKIVSRDRQRASLIFLLNQIRDLEWLENMEFIRNMPLKNSIKDLVRDRLSGMIISSAKRVHFGSTKSDDPYTTKECLEDLYTNIFKSLDSKETPSKTEMKLQKDFIAEIVDAAELSSDSDTPLYALNTISKKRELIEKMQSSEPPKGFELWVLFNYDIGDYEKSLFYGYLEKTKDRVLKRMRNCSPEARLHYELLLRTIQKSIK